MSATELLAIASGLEPQQSSHRCFWCASPAIREYEPPTGFTNWSEVASPSSRWICAGCKIATDESDKSQRPRLHSWLITAHRAEKRTKGAIQDVAAWCLYPPDPPFAIVVAVSGQKNLIYRAPVNHTRDTMTVQFETERVNYRPVDLRARLNLCMRICAATGKPALTETPRAGLIARLVAHYGDDVEELLTWHEVWNEPLSRLAAFLCPKKEVCLEHHPVTVPHNVQRERLAAKAGRADGPGLFGN